MLWLIRTPLSSARHYTVHVYSWYWSGTNDMYPLLRRDSSLHQLLHSLFFCLYRCTLLSHLYSQSSSTFLSLNIISLFLSCHSFNIPLSLSLTARLHLQLLNSMGHCLLQPVHSGQKILLAFYNSVLLYDGWVIKNHYFRLSFCAQVNN